MQGCKSGLIVCGPTKFSECGMDPSDPGQKITKFFKKTKKKLKYNSLHNLESILVPIHPRKIFLNSLIFPFFYTPGSRSTDPNECGSTLIRIHIPELKVVNLDRTWPFNEYKHKFNYELCRYKSQGSVAKAV